MEDKILVHGFVCTQNTHTIYNEAAESKKRPRCPVNINLPNICQIGCYLICVCALFREQEQDTGGQSQNQVSW